MTVISPQACAAREGARERSARADKIGEKYGYCCIYIMIDRFLFDYDRAVERKVIRFFAPWNLVRDRNRVDALSEAARQEAEVCSETIGIS